jgi:hypothetical protein
MLNPTIFNNPQISILLGLFNILQEEIESNIDLSNEEIITKYEFIIFGVLRNN